MLQEFLRKYFLKSPKIIFRNSARRKPEAIKKINLLKDFQKKSMKEVPSKIPKLLQKLNPEATLG